MRPSLGRRRKGPVCWRDAHKIRNSVCVFTTRRWTVGSRHTLKNTAEYCRINYTVSPGFVLRGDEHLHRANNSVHINIDFKTQLCWCLHQLTPEMTILSYISYMLMQIIDDYSTCPPNPNQNLGRSSCPKLLSNS